MHKRPLQERQGDGPLEYRARFRHSVIAGLALREKQIQQNYRPIIAVHKCLARRPGTLFRALLLAAFGNRPVRQGFFRTDGFPGLRVADPLMGGGTMASHRNMMARTQQRLSIGWRFEGERW